MNTNVENQPADTNATNDPTASLRDFALNDLARYTQEEKFSPNASQDFHLFYVGRDNVHEVLKHVLSRVRTSLYLNMFGYDDDELNDIIMDKVKDPDIVVLITLDKSQAGGVHEKKLIALDQEEGLANFNTHFVIGQSPTHQISHTKGFVADGLVGGEGSTNWSDSGEGTRTPYVVKGTPVKKGGYKAQNNTQTIFTDPDAVRSFQAELLAEHMAAKNGEDPEAPAELRQRRAPRKPAAGR